MQRKKKYTAQRVDGLRTSQLGDKKEQITVVRMLNGKMTLRGARCKSMNYIEGRPRKIWLDDIKEEEYMKSSGMFRNDAQIRSKRRKKINGKLAMANPGLL